MVTNWYLGMLVAGKRIEEIMDDIPFMTQMQLWDFSSAFYTTIEAHEYPYAPFEPVSVLINERHDYYEQTENAEIAAGVASGKFIKIDYKVYERNVFALIAMRAMFGDDLVKEVFVERKHLEYLRKNAEMNKKECIIDTFINDAELLELDISGMDMLVEFTNGRMIEMTNSEWGGYTKIR
jgi:hypothetical protein